MMMTKLGCKTVKGTDLEPGDHLLLFGTVAKVIPGRNPAGGRFADVVTDTGQHRCWEGFGYHVKCEVTMDLSNSTPAELARMP
jgi:hypothetical protein